jgi:outer membrane protein OmpA-like peptidoglycan-associated protein
MSNEPNVVPGDSGEYVTLLQERLQRLGYYEDPVNGEFGQATETAVQRFQEAAGLDQHGQADETTWAALDRYEAFDGGGHQETGGAHEEATGERQLSEDGNWWWDGTDWQPVEGQETAEAADVQPDVQVAFQLSPDGQWQWDGAQWLPTGQTGGPGLRTASTAEALTGFETGLADLLPEHMAILDALAADLNAHPLNGGYVTLSGGADRRGDPAANKALGLQRAEVVRDYLLRRVDDEETRQEIRAYSIGAPEDGPLGDQPDLRRVDIAVARRTIDLPKPHPTDPLPRGPLPSTDLDPIFKLPPQKPGPEDPRHPTWPDWFWTQLPPRPAQPGFLHELSEWLNKALGTHDLARIGGRIASVLGFDADEVTRALDEAFQSGGEEGVKALLEKLFRQLNTPSPQAPGRPDPIPFPDPDGKTPEIRF